MNLDRNKMCFSFLNEKNGKEKEVMYVYFGGRIFKLKDIKSSNNK